VCHCVPRAAAKGRYRSFLATQSPPEGESISPPIRTSQKRDQGTAALDFLQTRHLGDDGAAGRALKASQPAA